MQKMYSIWTIKFHKVVQQHILGVVDTDVRRFVGNLTGFQQWKSFKNWLNFDEIIVTIEWRVF